MNWKDSIRCSLILTAIFCGLARAESESISEIKDFGQFKKACSSAGTPVVLVNVWAVNCSHCMDELTVLSKFAREQFKGSKELGFLSICLADASQSDFGARYKSILAKKNIPYSSHVWGGELSVLQKELQLESTPYTGLFDNTGRLIEILELPRGEAKAEGALREAVKKALTSPTK